MIANSGHFNDEINIPALEELATGGHRPARDFVDEYSLDDGRNVYLLAEGRLVNLAAAEGHPASVMDMSFANQALGAEYMLQQRQGPGSRSVYTIPREIDHEIARLKLQGDGHRRSTRLTAEQQAVPGRLGVGHLGVSHGRRAVRRTRPPPASPGRRSPGPSVSRTSAAVREMSLAM